MPNFTLGVKTGDPLLGVNPVALVGLPLARTRQLTSQA